MEGSGPLSVAEEALRSKCSFQYEVNSTVTTAPRSIVSAGFKGSGKVLTTPLPAGNHTITVWAINFAGEREETTTVVTVPQPTASFAVKPPKETSSDFFFFEFGSSPNTPETYFQYFHHPGETDCATVYKRDYIDTERHRSYQLQHRGAHVLHSGRVRIPGHRDVRACS
jgi:hypothetical protein